MSFLASDERPTERLKQKYPLYFVGAALMMALWAKGEVSPGLASTALVASIIMVAVGVAGFALRLVERKRIAQ